MFQNIHLANYVNQNSAGQKARGRTPKESRGTGSDSFFNQVAPGSDPHLHNIVVQGTHLSGAGYTKKTTGLNHYAHSQTSKKLTQNKGEQTKSTWRPPPKKDFIKQMNSNKPKLNSDLFPSNLEQKFYINQYHITQKAIRERTNPRIPNIHNKLNSPRKITAPHRSSSDSQRRKIEHTLHQYTTAEKKTNKGQDTTLNALIFNSSLKKAKDGQDNSMFEEPLASSSKDEPDKDHGIIYGENQIAKEQDVSSISNAI